VKRVAEVAEFALYVMDMALMFTIAVALTYGTVQ
jgi:hypothetical protein